MASPRRVILMRSFHVRSPTHCSYRLLWIISHAPETQGTVAAEHGGTAAKLRLKAATWVMLSAKRRHRSYLQGLQLSHFDRFLEFLLGDKCYSMQVASSMPASSAAHAERQSLSVPWNVLLQYEFELRKWAIKEAHREGLLWGISFLRPLGFTSQVALSKRSSASDPPPPEWPRVGKGTKGGKGGKEGTKDGKGKSTGKIQVGDAWYDLVSKTPDGRELCYAYNIKRGCHVKGCQRVHACRVKGCQGRPSGVSAWSTGRILTSSWDA